ncbi:MAG: serine hydrolase [Patescibacteria group bacterium]
MSGKSVHKILSALLALLVGVSVPYFLIDIGEKAYAEFAPPAVVVPLPNLGSNDADSTPMPDDSEPVPVNPNISGQYYFEGPNYQVPQTSAQAYVVGDVDTGEIIIEKNQNDVHPIASVSKLITALVAKANMDQHKPVTVSRSSIDIYGSSGGLSQGEKILVTDLYYPLLMESSNDAAEVFAEGYGYDDFINLMNKQAGDIGMASTSFFEPSGLSEKNVSTARDLFKLAGYITNEHPDIWDITRVRQYSIRGHAWGNSSQISRKVSFIGGKNGFTYEANETAVVVLNIPLEGGIRRIGITLLKSNAREVDVNALERFVAKWVGFLPKGENL